MKTKISLRIDEKLLEDLDFIFPRLDDKTQTDQFTELLQMTIASYKDAIGRSAGMFKSIEFLYISQSLNGALIDFSMFSIKKILIMQLTDFIEYGSMGFYSNEDIDTDAILEKLNQMDSMQALFLYNSVRAFWEESNGSTDDLSIVESK